MDELLKWIDEKENILKEKDQEPIPEDDYDEVQLLLEEHKVCRDKQSLSNTEILVENLIRDPESAPNP